LECLASAEGYNSGRAVGNGKTILDFGLTEGDTVSITLARTSSQKRLMRATLLVINPKSIIQNRFGVFSAA
jgi:hypothetical protein